MNKCDIGECSNHSVVGLLVIGLLFLGYVALLARGADIISQSTLDEAYEEFLDAGECRGEFGQRVNCYE